MNRLILSKIEELKYKVSDDYVSTTSDTNNNATKTYNTISNITQEVTTIKNKIGVLSDMFTDLRVLNGTAKNIINLSTVPIVENNGIKIINDKFELDTAIKNKKEISVKDSSISSLSKYTLTTSDNKKTDVDSFLKTNIDTTVTFPNTRYTFNLNLRYPLLEQINSIEIQLGLLTESYPIINSIKYVDKDNIEQTAIILNNTSTNYDLDYYREKDNKYVIDISSILTDQITIEFTSKTSSSLVLKSIQTYFKREVESGEVILGPIHTNTPLIKLALDTENISSGTSFEFSTDLQYWLKLDSSSIITSDTNTKILSFNTVNNNSIKTNEDIYTFYIKATLASSVLTNEDSTVDIYNTIREDNSLNNDIIETVENNLLSVYKVKNSDFIHGQYQYIDNLNTKDFNIKLLEYIEVNGISKVLGLIDTPYSISNTTINSGGIGAELKLKRLNANKINSATSYDLANSKVYDIYPREIEETINTRQKDNLCFYIKKQKAEDIYTIMCKDSKKSLQIDLTTPFVLNSSATIINVPYENILIKNSIGELIEEVDKDTLLTIKEKDAIGEDITYYFLSLVDVLFDPIEVKGYTYNKLYPLVDLAENEYGLDQGKIITGKEVLVSIKGVELIKTEVEIVKVVNYTNGNYFKRTDDNFTYYSEQTLTTNTLKSIVKLNNTSIEKGSIVIEEYYEKGEDYISLPTNKLKYINVNTIENPAYLQVDTDTYLQE